MHAHTHRCTHTWGGGRQTGEVEKESLEYLRILNKKKRYRWELGHMKSNVGHSEKSGFYTNTIIIIESITRPDMT